MELRRNVKTGNQLSGRYSGSDTISSDTISSALYQVGFSYTVIREISEIVNAPLFHESSC